MSDRIQKTVNKQARTFRTRAKIKGTANRPRLTVTISNMHISAQIISDETQQTLASATTVGKKLTGTMTDKAEKIGEQIATAAKKVKVTKVVFDRGHKQYHGRIKALAEAARKNGLEF